MIEAVATTGAWARTAAQHQVDAALARKVASSSALVSRFLLHRAGFARCRGSLGSGRLAVGGRAQALGLVGDADQEHGRGTRACGDSEAAVV